MKLDTVDALRNREPEILLELTKSGTNQVILWGRLLPHYGNTRQQLGIFREGDSELTFEPARFVPDHWKEVLGRPWCDAK